MKYKAIKSAAHNFARSFASSLNWAESDYVMSHLLRAAIATRTRQYHIDLTTGSLTPSTGVTVQFDIDGASVFEPPGEYEAAFT
jgi:hypothetical protein